MFEITLEKYSMEIMNIIFLHLKSISDSVASKLSVFVAVLFPLLRKSVLIFTIKFYLKIVRKKEIIIKQEREK